MTDQSSRERLYVFDTTLRDGAQTPGIEFSLEDKMAVVKLLEELGVDYIEGGYPGANVTDTAFFAEKRTRRATFTAFGMTKRAGRSVGNDPGVQDILNSAADAACFVAKASVKHVRVALGISLEENLRSLAETVAASVASGKETLIDSAAILDWLDQSVGPARALVPAAGPDRRHALQRIALATGAIDKAGAATYERLVRPSAYRWPDWIDRCRIQATGAIQALSAEAWPSGATLDQAQITTACMICYVRMTDPDLLPSGRYPALDALSDQCEARAEFAATRPVEYNVPRSA